MSTARPGEFLRRQLLLRSVPLWLLVGASVVAAVLGFRWWPLSMAALALALGATWLGRDGSWGDPIPWLWGLRGEKAVGSILEGSLDPGAFHVLHDVPARWGNVDHVVVGPTGIFAIETKAVTGRVYTNGRRLMRSGTDARHITGQATRGAKDIRRRLERAGLPGWVEAVVAMTRAEVRPGRIRVANVTVAAAERLPEVILGGRRRLDPRQVLEAAAAIASGGAAMRTALPAAPA